MVRRVFIVSWGFASMANVNPGPATTVNPNSMLGVSPVNTQQYGGLYLLNNGFRLLGSARGVNANVVGDTPITIVNTAVWSPLYIIKTNASISLTTATGGVYTALSAGGTAILTTAALSGNTSSTVVVSTAPTTTAVQSVTTVYWHIGTAQGAAATLDVFIYGFDFT